MSIILFPFYIIFYAMAAVVAFYGIVIVVGGILSGIAGLFTTEKK